MNFLDRNEFNFQPSQKVIEAVKSFDPQTLCFYTRIYDEGKKSVISVKLSEIYGIPEEQVLLTYGGEEAFKKLLPIIDDFERAVEHNEKTEDVAALREGFKLIFGKLRTYLEQSGVTVIPAAAGDDFDENLHEAITMCPSPTPELKGKLVDCATKGYKYKDKVIRIAKVVVGD